MSNQFPLISLMQKLGYTSNDEGVCEGVAMMGIQAFLCGESNVFIERMQSIDTDQAALLQMFNQLFKKIAHAKARPLQYKLSENLTQDDLKIINLKAFFEGIELYLQPELYASVLNKNVNQGQVEITSSFIQPEALEKQGGMIIGDSWSGVYSQEDLHNYILALNDTAVKNAQDIAIEISGHFHAMAICFDSKTRQWTLIDANRPIMTNLSVESLTQNIARGYVGNDFKTTPVIFNSRLITVNANKKNIETFADDLNENALFIDAHKLDIKKVFTKASMSLAEVAIAARDLPLFERLLKDYSLDLNSLLDTGATVLTTIAYDGDPDLLRIAVENNVRLDIPDAGGMLPIQVAIEKGHLAAVKILFNHVPASEVNGILEFVKELEDTDPEIVEFLQNQSSIYRKFENTIAAAEINEVKIQLNLILARAEFLKNKLADDYGDAKTPDNVETLIKSCEGIIKFCRDLKDDKDKIDKFSTFKNLVNGTEKTLDALIQLEITNETSKGNKKTGLFTQKNKVNTALINTLKDISPSSSKVQQLRATLESSNSRKGSSVIIKL